MEDMKTTIGKNIRILRKQKGQTLQSLSKQIGITHQQLSRIENGGGTSTATLERIAAVLGVDMPILIDEPEATLHRSLELTRNFVPDQFCNTLYAGLFDSVIKPVNDIVLEKFMDEIIKMLVSDRETISNCMTAHVGRKDNYEFTFSELEKLCVLLFADFAEQIMKLSKNRLDESE